jgi:hypothetical protein
LGDDEVCGAVVWFMLFKVRGGEAEMGDGSSCQALGLDVGDRFAFGCRLVCGHLGCAVLLVMAGE